MSVCVVSVRTRTVAVIIVEKVVGDAGLAVTAAGLTGGTSRVTRHAL